MRQSYRRRPCKNCPFRHDVKPYLHPERAEELAYAASNPYNQFWCHKTTRHDEDCDDRVAVSSSQDCAGFLTLMANELGEDRMPDGFKPAYDLIYSEPFDMVAAFEEEWERVQ